MCIFFFLATSVVKLFRLIGTFRDAKLHLEGGVREREKGKGGSRDRACELAGLEGMIRASDSSLLSTHQLSVPKATLPGHFHSVAFKCTFLRLQSLPWLEALMSGGVITPGIAPDSEMAWEPPDTISPLVLPPMGKF